MSIRRLLLRSLTAITLLAPIHPTLAQKTFGTLVPKPLFRDPIHDGAADPSIIWNTARHQWWMFYTNRRADQATEGKDVSWVHRTRLGIATSKDGAHWTYQGEAQIPYGTPEFTHWAPEIIRANGSYHMYLTIVPGTFADWAHPRSIIHLTSPDLLHWTFINKLTLSSERVIDPAVFRLPNGHWRIWYKDEADSSHIHYADTTGHKDLSNFTPAGVAVSDRSSEAPKVFWWHGHYWLLNDTYTHGLGVYRSEDATTWQRQPANLLEQPGTLPTDRTIGKHPDIVISNDDRAYLFYFTHQSGPDLDPNLPHSAQRTVLQVTELHEANGTLTTDRNIPTYASLPAPKQDPRTY